MRSHCRICGVPLNGAERQIGTCIKCVHEVRYKKVTIKDAGYNHGASNKNGPGQDRNGRR